MSLWSSGGATSALWLVSRRLESCSHLRRRSHRNRSLGSNLRLAQLYTTLANRMYSMVHIKAVLFCSPGALQKHTEETTK